jgi:hypothetical protein
MAKLTPHVIEDVQAQPDPIETAHVVEDVQSQPDPIETAHVVEDVQSQPDPIETAHVVEDVQAQPDPIETAATPAANDPFDLTKLRLSQNFVETAGVKKLLTTVPVRKPHPQEFIRVHPSPEYRAALAVIELKDDREIYLLTPDIARELPGEYVSVMLYTAINRQGVVFLWPVRLPAPDGRVIEWHRSAAEAAELAMLRWVRIKANMALGAYEIFAAASTIPDPEWSSPVPRAAAYCLPRSVD